MTVDNRTANYDLKLPHRDNDPYAVDVQRIADALSAIDLIIKQLSDTSATAADVDTRLQELIGAAPAALDTLSEIATALGNDPNLSATLTSQISEKLAKASNLSDLSSIPDARTTLDVFSKAEIAAVLAGYYTKVAADAAFLGIGATAANATRLGGQLASYFAAAANYYDKTTSDDRYLGKTAKAADSNKLGGKNASEYITAIAILEDQKPSGVDGQVGSTSWYVRHLNTEVSDPNGMVTLASNEFTVSKDCFAIITSPGRDLSQYRLWNVTNNTPATGVTYSYSGGGYTFPNTFFARLTAGKKYRVEQKDNNVLSNVNASGAGVEVYTRVMLIG